jgi:nicotinate-nucleotide--dimethylbenzimidazole phosphoribosyltransferase
MDTSFPPIADLTQPEMAARLQQLLDNKTKPVGSLGQLEALAQRIGLILGSEVPVLNQPQLVVFAGDHGLAARGVSAYPSDVTWQMVENFLAGGAAVSVLARQHGIGLTVVDCGVRHDFAPRPGLVISKIAAGTADALEGPAMTLSQCQAARANGAALVKKLPGNALLLGEMGIGNTSAAALLMARLTGLDIGDCTGAGTGLDAQGVARKVVLLRQVLARHTAAREPLDALAAFGGFEIATMVGAILEAARERRVIVVDGFIASAAVLVASRLQPHVLQRCVFAHRSGERGHALMLAHLRAEPLLDLGLRLGEGSGAALAWPLLLSACALLREMASFESAGVSRQDETVVTSDPVQTEPSASARAEPTTSVRAEPVEALAHLGESPSTGSGRTD